MKKFSSARGPHAAWLIWAASVFFYFYEFFVRVAPGSMFGDMQRTYGVTAGLLGFASGVYYYIYSPVQIVAGALFDHFGGRKVLIPASLCVTLGCACVLLPPHALWAFAVGRFLMGLGSGFGFIGVMYLATVCFHPRRLSFLSGLTTAAGFGGAILTLQQIPQLVHRIGWHGCWLGASILGLLSTLVLFLVLPRPETKSFTPSPEPVSPNAFRGLLQVLKNPQTWVIGLIAGALYATPTVFGDLWGNTYLQITLGMPDGTAGAATAMLYVGWLLGAPFFGWLSDRLQRKKIFLQLGALTCGVLLTIFLCGEWSPGAVRALLFLTGFFGAPEVACFSASIEKNPPHASGSAVAVVNMITMFTGGLIQPVVGGLLDMLAPGDFRLNAHDLRLALGVLPLVTFLGFAATFLYREDEGDAGASTSH